MRCHDFRQRLNELLDRRQWPEQDNQLQGHAQGCRGCRELLALQAEMRAVFAPRSGALVEMAQLDPRPIATRSSSPRVRAARPWQILAAAATLVLGAILWWGALGQQGHETAALRGSSRAPSQRGGDLRSPPTSSPLAVSPSEISYWALVSPFQWGVTVSRVELSWDGWPAFPETRADSAWLQPFEQGLAPLTHSIVSTLKVLRSTWPVPCGRRDAERVEPGGAAIPLSCAHAS
jgi:hypothetical protein